MATVEQLLSQIEKAFPGQSFLKTEEVAKFISGVHSKPAASVVEGVREKIRSGYLKATRWGEGAKGTLLVNVHDLAEVLAHSPAPNAPPQPDPIQQALRAPVRGKRHRPLINPGVMTWMVLWRDIFGILGWADAEQNFATSIQEILNSELVLLSEEERSMLVKKVAPAQHPDRPIKVL